MLRILRGAAGRSLTGFLLAATLLVTVSGFAVVAPAEAATTHNWFFAEGYTAPGFQEYLCVGNPTANAATVKAEYMYNGGGSVQRSYSVAPHSRSTIDVNAAAGSSKEVSVRVTSSNGSLAVERSMYFVYHGEIPGSHTVAGARSTSRAWYFAEGYTGPVFEEYVCVLNPWSSRSALTFKFQTPAGEHVRTGSVAARSRATFKVNDLLGNNIESSLKIEASAPVVAERPVYFNYLGPSTRHWTGGHCVMGSTSTGKSFYFAEGTTRPGFEAWLTVQNVNAKAINVKAVFTFATGQGAPVTKDYVIGAKKRFTIFVPDATGPDKDVSTYLSSSSNFLAERPTYFAFSRGPLSYSGGHCAIGAPAASTSWCFAEGYTGHYFEQWLCVQNPSTRTARIAVDYFTQDRGALPTRVLSVPGKTRLTVLVNEHAGQGFSLACRLRVTSGPPVVAERLMYFDLNGNPARPVNPTPAPGPSPNPGPTPSPGPQPALSAGLYGMCYSPYLTSWTVSAQEMSTQLDRIAPYTRWIRTFCSQGDGETILSLAKSKGINVAGGCWIWDNPSSNQREVDALVAQVRRGDVKVAVVGDEMLENNALSEDELISYIRQVKAAGASVSTSMTYTEWPKHPRLIAECDFITANMFPYWDQAAIEDAITRLEHDYQMVKAVAGGKKIVVETGWPTAGQTRGRAVASAENAAKFLAGFKGWAAANGVEYFYFEAFDESWKGEGGCGPHWGIWTTSATLKPEYAAVLKPWR